MIDGTVVSKAGKYGFVRDSDGISYYFNEQSLHSGHTLSSIAIGDRALFTAKAGPKGMIATGLRKLETYPAYRPGKRVIFSKEESPFRANELPVNETFIRIQTTWYRAPDDARAQLDRAVKATGANAVINAGMYRQTWSSGNYRYSMHSSYADVGVYFVAKQVERERDAQSVTAKSEAWARSVKEALDEKKAWLDEQRKNQESVGLFNKILNGILLAIVLLFFGFFFFFWL